MEDYKSIGNNVRLLLLFLRYSFRVHTELVQIAHNCKNFNLTTEQEKEIWTSNKIRRQDRIQIKSWKNRLKELNGDSLSTPHG